jgi:molybdopterin adenylyltransferase
MRAAILTVSTSVAAGETEDRSGPELAARAEAAGVTVVERVIVHDDRDQIAGELRRLSSGQLAVDLVFTTGGTGLTADDVTPEATRDVIDREAPGFAEALRADAVRHTPMGILSRGVSGIAGRTLIVNFPGNPKAVTEGFAVLAPVLAHAVETLGRESGRGAGH